MEDVDLLTGQYIEEVQAAQPRDLRGPPLRESPPAEPEDRRRKTHFLGEFLVRRHEPLGIGTGLEAGATEGGGDVVGEVDRHCGHWSSPSATFFFAEPATFQETSATKASRSSGSKASLVR